MLKVGLKYNIKGRRESKVRRLIQYLKGIAKFERSLCEFKEKQDNNDFLVRKKDLHPILSDASNNAGSVDGHYFLQDIYMAKKVCESGVKIHYDIGSRVDGFISHLLSAPTLDKVVMIDIRQFPFDIEGLDFICDDATTLKQFKSNSIESLSSLHAVEHFGLGRYGDEINPDAWKTVIEAMADKIKIGGYLYLSVPVGNEQKVCFNAHRIFHPKTIVEAASGLNLQSFTYISDFKVNEVQLSDVSEIHHKLGDYDCGLFVFKK